MAETFDVVFHGKSESECTSFIRAVRKYAKRNQKIRDNRWIADELYDAFDEKALGWYVRLPVNIRGDWELLQQALAAQWITNVNDNVSSSPAIQSTVAAAAPAACPPNPAPSVTSTQTSWVGKVGRVRQKVKNSVDFRYLSKEVTTGNTSRLGAFDVTRDAALSLKVRPIMVGPNLYRLVLVEHESKLLVLAAFNYNTDDWHDLHALGLLVGVDMPGQGSLNDRKTTYHGWDHYKTRPFWTETWQIEDTGTLKLRGPGDSTEIAAFSVNAEGPNKDLLSFWGPKSQYRPTTETDLEFEPLDNR